MYRWISDVSSYPALDAQTDFGPAFEFEYSTRDAYGAAVPDWGPDDPLNATWWHRVTEGTRMITPSLVIKRLVLTKFSSYLGSLGAAMEKDDSLTTVRSILL